MSSHTLTVSGSLITVTKNGSVITTPYSLQNGDVITIDCATTGVNINGVEYLNRAEAYNISISNQDIAVTEISRGPQLNPCIVNITYTA